VINKHLYHLRNNAVRQFQSWGKSLNYANPECCTYAIFAKTSI